ncbi:MAG: hypothetical protein AAFY24_22315 [Pseudomonadota bacterium]
MHIYHYDPSTGEFLAAAEARADPRDPERFLVPRGATASAPPVAMVGQARVFLEGSWQYVPDHRGETWYRGFGVPVVVSRLGDPAVAGLTSAEPAAPPPTNDEVDAERQRRIDQGAEFDLVGGLTIAITGRQRDQTTLTGVYMVALAQHGAGETGQTLVYRDRTNVNHMLTPQQVIDLYLKGLQWITAIMQVSWDMKDGAGIYTDGIPADYVEDDHWPTPADLAV